MMYVTVIGAPACLLPHPPPRLLQCDDLVHLFVPVVFGVCLPAGSLCNGYKVSNVTT
jgi:hypothetical protein